MNTTLTRTTLAATLLVASAGAVPAPVTPSLPMQPMMDAVQAASADYLAAGQGSDDPKLLLDRYMLAAPSAATRAKLLRAFGSEQPLHIVRKAGPAGRSDYRLSFIPGEFSDPATNMKIDWTGLNADISIDRTHRVVNFNASLDQAGMHYGGLDLRVQGLRYTGKHVRSRYPGLSDIDSDATIDKLVVGGADGVTLSDWHTHTEARVAGPNLDFGYKTSVKTTVAGPDQAARLTINLALRHLDAQALSDMTGVLAKEAGIDRPADAKAAIFTRQFKILGHALALHGAELELKELGVDYGGHSASLNGKLALAGVREDELDHPTAIWKRVTGHFDFHMPLPMLQEIAIALTQKAMSAQMHTPVTRETAAAASTQVYSSMLVSATAGGLARVDGTELRSSIDIKDGRILINGKDVTPAMFR